MWFWFSQVSEFLKCCGVACLYGQKPETLDSLLLTLLPFHIPSTPAAALCCSKRLLSKEAKLLASLEWAVQCQLGFRFIPVRD